MDLLKEYQTCQIRGHIPKPYPDKGFNTHICQFCGTYFRYETNIVELNQPESIKIKKGN